MKITIIHWPWSYFGVIFVALKVMGYVWSWWWLFMPAVPCVVELFHFIGKYVK